MSNFNRIIWRIICFVLIDYCEIDLTNIGQSIFMLRGIKPQIESFCNAILMLIIELK